MYALKSLTIVVKQRNHTDQNDPLRRKKYRKKKEAIGDPELTALSC